MFESDSEGNLVEFDLNIYLFDPLACAAAARSNAQASAIALTKFSSFVLRQPSHPTSGWLHRARQAPKSSQKKRNKVKVIFNLHVKLKIFSENIYSGIEKNICLFM